jgi:hypothetical protein
MIIGFSGSFGSGKTTRAQSLSYKLNEMGKETYVTNFADNLKKMLAKHFGISFEKFEKSEICPINGISYGKLLQKYGQGMRDIDPYFWIDELYQEIKDKNCIIIIGDVRYQNELDWISRRGGMVFKKEGIRESSIAGRDLNHPSEGELSGFTRIFPQETSVEKDVDEIINISFQQHDRFQSTSH